MRIDCRFSLLDDEGEVDEEKGFCCTIAWPDQRIALFSAEEWNEVEDLFGVICEIEGWCCLREGSTSARTILSALKR